MSPCIKTLHFSLAKERSLEGHNDVLPRLTSSERNKKTILHTYHEALTKATNQPQKPHIGHFRDSKTVEKIF